MIIVISQSPHSGTWWSTQKTKPSTLPPLGQASSQAKRKTKSLTKVQSGEQRHLGPMVVTTYQPREPEDSHLKDKLNSRKIQAKVRFMRSMVRNQRTSLLEMRQHKFFLRKLCDKLVRAIQDTEDSTALRVRAMLQQQDALTVSPPIAPSPGPPGPLQAASSIQMLQVEQLNAEVEKTQEEVNFLSTYMDHEYPVRSLQIANLARQLQQAKDDQQDELDNLAEMRRMVLELLSAKIWKKKEKILSSLAMRTLQPHEEALLQKTQDSQYRQRCRGTVMEVSGQEGDGPSEGWGSPEPPPAAGPRAHYPLSVFSPQDTAASWCSGPVLNREVSSGVQPVLGTKPTSCSQVTLLLCIRPSLPFIGGHPASPSSPHAPPVSSLTS
uniref:Uncharacterized protein n=1 Tax=Spermophilus dauricus TaxID=99837 RepID=A0A8C9PPE2_SPEDA